MFKVSSCGSNAGMDKSASLVNAIVNNAVFHSSSHISQHSALPQITDVLRFLAGRLIAPDFTVNWNKVRAVCRPQIWKFIQIYRIVALSDCGSE